MILLFSNYRKGFRYESCTEDFFAKIGHNYVLIDAILQ
jgi:hypothetical protein